VLVREAVSAGDGSVVLVDKCVMGCDERVVLLAEGLDPAREARLRTSWRCGAGLGHLSFDSIDAGVRRVALPLEVAEGLLEAQDFSADGRESCLVDIDLSLQRLLIVLDLCLVF